ncbi:MAG: hypothetical protein IPG32_05900 [Saprospirales bacterium]|nr:hypothetical protein [Saprospirales bacterium]
MQDIGLPAVLDLHLGVVHQDFVEKLVGIRGKRLEKPVLRVSSRDKGLPGSI